MKVLVVVAAAFCVFCLSGGALFFVFGGFVLVVFKHYLLFALIVAVPSLFSSLFAALVVASPAGFPPPIGDLVSRN